MLKKQYNTNRKKGGVIMAKTRQTKYKLSCWMMERGAKPKPLYEVVMEREIRNIETINSVRSHYSKYAFY